MVGIGVRRGKGKRQGHGEEVELLIASGEGGGKRKDVRESISVANSGNVED